MNFFHFGNENQLCFGAYHPAHPARDRRAGVVLCYPIGQEYMRAHRCFVALAGRLSAAGFHTLRFDYFATGDSPGDTSEGRWPIWLQNIAEAVQELQNSAEVSSISLVGMRLGALLALEYAQNHRLARLVLWDPVLNGQNYLQELRQRQREWLADLPFRPSTAGGQNGGLESLGYALSPELVSQIGAKNPLQIDNLSIPATLIIESAGAAETRALLSNVAGKAEVRHVILPNSRVWQKAAGYNSVLIPNEALRTILQWLQEAQ